MNNIVIPKTVRDFHITSNGHVWIDGVMGGSVEMSKGGRYYTAKTVQRALNNYDKRYKQYLKEYMRGQED